MVPEHLGSSRNQLESLLSGQANDVISRTEFLDRPLDVSHALDALAQKAETDATLKNKLNFEQVGVIGQSFGGYTALALAGATLNFDQLESDCDVNLDDTYNLSLLLQCLALRLTPQDYELSDPRVKGIIAVNPVGSSLFSSTGISKIKVPTLIVGGSSDTVAPLVPEQAAPYSWLTTPNRYFALVNGGTHFSFIEADSSDLVTLPQFQDLVGPRPDIARSYLQQMSLAFFNHHIAERETDLSSPSDSARLSRQPLPLSIVTNLPPLKFSPFTSPSAQR